MNAIIQEAILPALEQLRWQYLNMPESNGIVVPMAYAPPASSAFLIMIETDDVSDEALLHAGVCTAPSARRAPVALALAELNTLYRFVTFSMAAEGDVRIDVGVQLAGVTAGMRPKLVELGLRRLVHALMGTYDRLLKTAQGRGRRPRVEREIDDLLRNIDRS